jgi:serine/threonine-protein kinase
MPTTASVCPKCGRGVEDGWRVCPVCAASLEAATMTPPPNPESVSSSSGIEEGRFPAGTVLSGRYRILGLLGHGGMGEVYRAYDQILNQAVALKFIAGPELGEAALARFRNEVRVARQVSHPNVCRVYDIGFVEGTHFLSMEYLDGEDLGSLLRRIGRLPQDKAIEFTRKICAGLAAAHERGVLHRDLKPSNIMIDGRGQVRITDFGLAGFAREIPLSDLRSGTPAYMSPEQKAGREVTTRSDLYALGLVLYEMFTGRRRSGSPSTPGDVVKDLDPAIERVILRCLEEDPKRRPSSALNVAMALPGADPVAAALAAGETPSPEMVAASQEKQGFTPRTAIPCFAVVVIATLLGQPLAQRTTFVGSVPLPIPPDGLAFRARQILQQVGYAEEPFDAYGFAWKDDATAVEANARRYGPANANEILVSHRPPMATFWYRQHRRELFTTAFANAVAAPGVLTEDQPPLADPGMVLVELDPLGRLTRLDVRPWIDEAAPRNVAADPTVLFAAADLDLGRFATATPRDLPLTPFDVRQAWTGSYAADRGEPVRVEAAFWGGRPVLFSVASSELSVPAAPTTRPGAVPRRAVLILSILVIATLITGGLMARHHLRSGRSDRRGAAVLAGAVFVPFMVAWLLSAGHVTSIGEFALFFEGLSAAISSAMLVWLVYLAIEPHVRRNWPDSLISWTRLGRGGFGDSLVASHVLAGLTAGAILEYIVLPGGRLILSSSLVAGQGENLNVLTGPAQNLALVCQAFLGFLTLSLLFLIVVVVLRFITRRLWIADVVGSFLLFGPLGLGVFGGQSTAQALAGFLTLAAAALVWMRLLRHLGFLTVLTIFSFGMVRPMPFALTGWLAARSIVLHLIPVALAAACLWVILAGEHRPAIESA